MTQELTTATATIQTTPTADEVRARFPEFGEAEFSEAVVNQAVSTAVLISSISLECILLLSAHLLALVAEDVATTDGGSGEVKMEIVGPKKEMNI